MRCTTCGEAATMLWAALDPKTMEVSSINGRGHLSPSCEDCGGDAEVDGFVTVRIPIGEVDL